MASSICERTNSKATPQYGLQFRADHRVPVPLEILACKPVSVACEPSLWPRLPRSGKRFSDARDRRPQTGLRAVLLLAETGSRPIHPRKIAGIRRTPGNLV